jgi:small-conductance mechanosensitive channel
MKPPQAAFKLVFLLLFLAVSATSLDISLEAQPPQSNPQFNPDRDAILGHLNEAITWYRDSSGKVEPVGLPSDAIYQDNARTLAAQAVKLAFESARAEAALVSSDQTPSANQKPAQAGQHNFRQMQKDIGARVADLQSQLDANNKQLARAPAAKRKALVAQRDALQGQLNLYKTVQDNLDKMADFMEGTSGGGEGLPASIEQLARSVPEIWGGPGTQKQAPKAPQSASGLANTSGLIGQALTLMERFRAVHDIDQMLKETDHVKQVAEDVRKPLRDALTATLQQGQNIASANNAQANATAASISQQFQHLTNTFKQLSDAVIPLAQEIIVIEQGRGNFEEWRKSILLESRYVLRGLAIRIIGIVLALAFVGILSEVWRRLTYRYIREPRRRRQFLLMRRFVMGFLVGIVLIVGFVSEFSSLATFAGFITAGIAVALQAVILSVAAYFFVVGRYGIRVGDRISVAGVTGDVIDIGLVRLYIMELAGTGVDLYPTGRVIVFSNSVLFQAGTPLFKQIPGTEYSWHELAVSVTPGSNYKAVQDKVSQAVHSVYGRYRDEFERQSVGLEPGIGMQLRAPEPETHLQLGDNGLELVLRYPVSIRRATEMDDEVTRAVMELIHSDAELQKAMAASPKIRAAIKG